MYTCSDFIDGPHFPDYAMRRRTGKPENKSTAAALAGITAVIGIVAYILLTVQPLPTQPCSPVTYNGTYGFVTECGGK